MRCVQLALLALCCVAGAAAEDWFVGVEDPNETLVVESDTYVDGTVWVVNHGRLEVRGGAWLTASDDVVLLDDAELTVMQAGLRLAQPYSYASAVVLAGRAWLEMADAGFDANWQTCSLALSESATLQFSNVTVAPGYITWVLFDDADATLEQTANAGEFLQMGRGALTIRDSSSVLYWLTLPDGAQVDVTLPAPGDVAGFTVDPNAGWASGIPYTFELTNCTNVTWASMARSGSQATYRDSDLLVSGAIFERSNDIEVVGLSNDVALADRTLQWGDVSLRFVNCHVGAWNYYAKGQTHLTLRSCVFGEVGANEQGRVDVIQSLCDGAGGYVGAGDSGQVLLYRSTNLSQTLATDGAAIIAVDSSLLDQRIFVRDSAVMLLLNTPTVSQPQAFDSANIVQLGLEPFTATGGSPLDIRGVARYIAGPESPLEFTTYELAWGGGEQPSTWTVIAEGSAPVPPGGTLGTWDTCGRVPGIYITRLRVPLWEDDPLEVTVANSLLEPPGGVCVGDLNCDGGVFLSDLSLLLASYGLDGNGDLDGDGDTDLADLSTMITNWETVCP